MSQEPLRCPSARCEPGAILLGIVLPGGRVAYAADRLVINEEFVAIAKQGRSPEARFRFSSPCARGACQQWTGSGCGVIDAVLYWLACFHARGQKFMALRAARDNENPEEAYRVIADYLRKESARSIA